MPLFNVFASEEAPSKARIVFESPRWWGAGKVFFTNEFIRASYETMRHKPFYTSIDVEINKKWTFLFKCSPFGQFTSKAEETRTMHRSKNGLFEFNSVRKVPEKWKRTYWGVDGTIAFGPGQEEISLLSKVMTLQPPGKSRIQSFSFIFNRSENIRLWTMKNGEREEVTLQTHSFEKTDNFIIEVAGNYVIDFNFDSKLSSPVIMDCEKGILIRPAKETVKIDLHITHPHAEASKLTTIAGTIKIAKKQEVSK